MALREVRLMGLCFRRQCHMKFGFCRIKSTFKHIYGTKKKEEERDETMSGADTSNLYTLHAHGRTEKKMIFEMNNNNNNKKIVAYKSY